MKHVMSVVLLIYLMAMVVGQQTLAMTTKSQQYRIQNMVDSGYIDLCTYNCGFESGNMTGWTQDGGSFDVASVFVRGGSYSVNGTSATNANFYQLIELDAFDTYIDQGYGTLRASAFIDPGKSERGSVVVSFFDASQNNVGTVWDSGWQYSPGTNWLEVANEIPIPINARSAKIAIFATRSSGSYTDVNVDDVTVRVRFIYPDITDTPTRTFTRSRTFTKTTTGTKTATMTRTPRPTFTTTNTPTYSKTQTPSKTRAPVLTNTPKQAITFTSTRTRSITRTRTATKSQTITRTRTATKSQTITRTSTTTPSVTPLPSICMLYTSEWDLCGIHVPNYRLEIIHKTLNFSQSTPIRVYLQGMIAIKICNIATSICRLESDTTTITLNLGIYNVCFMDDYNGDCGSLNRAIQQYNYPIQYIFDRNFISNPGTRIIVR
jgi:hypothetical protein